MKTDAREKAIILRKKGFTYSEILEEIPVAKSTLSLWLRQVHLAKKQEQRLTEKRKAAQLRGAAARHAQRVTITDSILKSSRRDIGILSKKELWLIGLALYWAEGGKEKAYAGANGVDLANTDPRMIRFFVRWLTKCCGIPTSRIYAHLYIHEYQRENAEEAVKYWSVSSGLAVAQITGVYFKRHNPTRVQHNKATPAR